METEATVRRPRVVFMAQDDVLALREVLAARMFERLAKREQLKKWEMVAARLATSGVQATAETLRRHVNDLITKHKKDGGALGGGRTRWGMEWPKSNEEIERDKLLKELVEKIDEAALNPPPRQRKKSEVNGARPSSTTTLRPFISNTPDTPPVQSKLNNIEAEPCRSACIRIPSRDSSQRSSPSSVLKIDSISFKELSTQQSHGRNPSQDSAPMPDSHGKLELKRRRLELEERVQNRMLDIQSKQVKLQREQLQIMRTVAQAMQAFARALHALETKQRHS